VGRRRRRVGNEGITVTEWLTIGTKGKGKGKGKKEMMFCILHSPVWASIVCIGECQPFLGSDVP
jgi:hypothetical protein